MKKKAIALMILISTFTFSKELRFKIFLKEPGESYIITDKEYTEISVKYDNDKISHWKLKAVDKGLHDSNYTIELIENNKYNHTFSLNKESNYWESSFIFPNGYKVFINFIDLNSYTQLAPALADTNADLLKSSISDFDNRKISKVKLNDKYNLWSRYSLEYNDHKFETHNLKYTFIKNVGIEFKHIPSKRKVFIKKSIIQTLNVGIDRVYKNSSTGIFLTLGLENSKGYEFYKLREGNKFEIIKDKKNGFYTADTVATMFGVGLSHSNSFSNGIYYDILAQASTFNRKMTSHDNQSANSRSYAISVSGELGAKINVTPDFSITPQLQQIYHYYHQNKFTNSVDITMLAQNEHIFNTRLGVKVGYKDIYGKVNTYLDYNKELNSVSVEGEVGLNKRINDKFNLHTSVAYQQEVYNRESKKDKINPLQKKIKLNLGISY